MRQHSHPYGLFQAARRAVSLLLVWLSACLSLAAERADSLPDAPEVAATLRRVFAFTDSFGLEALQYHSDIYLRHRMLTHRNGPVVRYIPGMLRLEKGTRSYLTEARLRLQLREPGETDCKVVAYHSTAKYQSANRLSTMSRLNFHLYHTNLISDALLNPLHRRNRRFYRYRSLGIRTDTVTGTRLQRISVIPRFDNDQLVRGHVDVDIRTGAVRTFRLSFRHNLQHITVSGETGGEGLRALLPERMHTEADFRLFGNRVYEVADFVMTHTFSYGTPPPSGKAGGYDLTRQCLLRLDTTQTVTDPAYFDSVRPDSFPPLDEKQLRYFRDRFARDMEKEGRMTGSTAFLAGSMPADTAARPSRLRIIGDRTQDILLSSHDFDITDNGRANVELPPVITPSAIQIGGEKGFSLRTQIKFKAFTSYSPVIPGFELSPSVGYSFKQKQVYWRTPLLLRFCPRLAGRFTLEAGGGSHIYNSRQADELHREMENVAHFDSLRQIIDHYNFHDYRDTYFKTDLSLSPLPGLTVTAGARYHRRTLIEWNDIAQQAGLSRKFTTLGPRVQLEWTPRQYYYHDGAMRVPLYSRLPTFRIAYERGYGIGTGNTRYERIEAEARYRLPLYAMRTLYFRVGGGTYLHRGEDVFLDYDFFRFDYLPEGWDDELAGTFQLLSSRWYNESRYYARATATYESPMLVFARIPGISRIIQKERVHLNLLSVRSLGIYTEAGYGISTHLMDLGCFVSVASDGSVRAGGKIGLRFFDD